jgi:hypothetical protein
METLRQFQVNFFGFSALDVDSCLQATFNVVGKGHQRKRYEKPRHRQPESAASSITASLQASYHGESLSFPGPSESNETTSVMGHIPNIRIICGEPFASVIGWSE